MAAAAGGPVVIVLAAGGSQRLGRDKLLEDIGGMPMLQRTVACYTKASRVGDVLVVLGPDQKPTWQWLASLRVHLIENPHPGRGMISSIRVGLGSAWAKDKVFLLAPGDVPFVKPEVVDKLLVDFRTRSPQILIPTYKGLGGHPGVYAASVQSDFFMHGGHERREGDPPPPPRPHPPHRRPRPRRLLRHRHRSRRTDRHRPRRPLGPRRRRSRCARSVEARVTEAG